MRPSERKIHNKQIMIYMYEGCPSKSWTFVIKRDCVSRFLSNLYDMFIYMYAYLKENLIANMNSVLLVHIAVQIGRCH